MLAFLFFSFFSTLISVSIGLMKEHFEKDNEMIKVGRLRFHYCLFCVC